MPHTTVSQWVGFATLALMAFSLAGCAPQSAPRPNFAAPLPTAARPTVTAAPGDGGGQVPRSPGNAALAFRAALLFETMCAELDPAQARKAANRLGFYRAGAAEAAVFLASQPGEVWIHGGYDNYVLTLMPGPPATCQLGVHLATPSQVEAPFAAMVQRQRTKGSSASRSDRGEAGETPRLWNLITPDGRRLSYRLVAQDNPGNIIRSVMIAQAAPR